VTFKTFCYNPCHAILSLSNEWKIVECLIMKCFMEGGRSFPQILQQIPVLVKIGSQRGIFYMKAYLILVRITSTMECNLPNIYLFWSNLLEKTIHFIAYTFFLPVVWVSKYGEHGGGVTICHFLTSEPLKLTLIKVRTSGFRTYFIFRCCKYHQ
jgi:hypothetical protein